MKILQIVGIKGNYINITEAIYNKPTANNIIRSGKNTESIWAKI